MIGPAARVTTLAPLRFDGVHVAVYFVIAAPLLCGARKVTCNEPGATFVTVGGAGARGVPTATPRVFVDKELEPYALIAVILKWYTPPLLRPVRVRDVAGELNVCGASCCVRLYGVIV